MDPKREANIKDRKYPGVTNYRGLALECTFYGIGSIAMSYQTYKHMMNNRNSLYSSILGLSCLWMLNLKTDMMADLLIHMDTHPELYTPNVPDKDLNEDGQE
jgi:broad specificity polyphosphatase/5'/3'-nucleotidase SurE